MDPGPGRYPLQQGWDNNSALDGFSAVHDPNFRVSGSYDERRFLDERYSRDDVYPRSSYHRDFLERDNHPLPPAPAGIWSQSRRRSYEEEYPHDRDSRRHQKTYVDSYSDMDTFHDHEINSFRDFDKFRDGYRGVDNFRDHEFDRPSRYGGRERDDYSYDDYDNRPRMSHQSRGNSHERDYEYGRHSYDSDYERGSWRDGNWRRRESRDRDRLSRERDQSPHKRHERSRSRSHGNDDRPRSRSPRGRNHGRSHRDDSYDDDRNEKTEKRRDREEKYQRERYSVAPSATVVVKGLSQKTTEEDLYQILAEWGPLRHVRVIKERNSGISRGFAFIDFPSVGAARTMMDRIGDDGLVVDGRKLFFEYSSKPTGGTGGPFGHDNAVKSGHSNHKSIAVPSDWMCTICGCVNFARRTSCFQCNEPRTDDSPAADISLSNSTTLGKKGSESGPTHVLVVRGLDENADEEMLRYEFSKHAPIKDLRLVRDKFTHVSRGFAFVHFHSVGDATKALEATNGTTLEKNGQILRVAYAKSILGPGSGTLGPSQSSSLAAAAIEAAAFSQQYDAVGWTPKEYNPDDKQSTSWQEQSVGSVAVQQDGSALHSGFVWDEASGYYFDAASGFYYDGNTGLYYDGNSGIWYSYDNQSQQYIPCSDQNDNKTPLKQSEASKGADGSSNRKVVISAPAATVTSVEKAASLPDVVQAAATAALAAEKKEKEKSKEIKLASKSSILANKKKMNNVLTMWKQRSHEGQATRLALDDNHLSASSEDRPLSAGQHAKSKVKFDMIGLKESNTSSSGVNTTVQAVLTGGSESLVKPRPVSNSSGGTLMGVIRGSARGLVKSDTPYSGSSAGVSTSSAVGSADDSFSSTNSDIPTVMTPFRTDASALGSYTPSTVTGSGKRRFSETPVSSITNKEQSQTAYRDRAAERRNLYGSSSSTGDGQPDHELWNSNRELAFKKFSSDPMPFPPGVGGGRGVVSDDVQSFEVITAEKAIDENNVGNRMLRSMGWHEGLGLGKDGSGMIEPVQAQAVDSRAGLGSQVKKLDRSLEVQAGDSYKTVIHKKALARFREMS
ncbi:SUPPRESSOR OF ABI3-5 isoform X2 [Durio zibethinus]|uniref:SUPPRESSOR OF ABI3-5 isoform X2 n=1 Tax=Durio zibethinus TaxID=66656 RepID=A0A6P6B4N4_DURZI|nr:SUPPRESSOR OF ABI3-5 isoform X2 [Durio zibethinus]